MSLCLPEGHTHLSDLCITVVMSRASEEFREQLRKDTSDDDMRILSPDLLSRVADPDKVNRFRWREYHDQSRRIGDLTRRTGDYDDMEKFRATKGDYKIDEREFALEDNIAMIYFAFYGENFEGGEIMDNPNDGWVCPGCKLKYVMSLKGLPDRCQRCGWLTPLGRLKKDDAFRR